MSSSSFDGKDIREIRDLLRGLMKRVSSLERHVGLHPGESQEQNAIDSPVPFDSKLDTNAFDEATTETAAEYALQESSPEIIDAEIVGERADPEIIFADLKQRVEAGAGNRSEARDPDEVEAAIPAAESGASARLLIESRIPGTANKPIGLARFAQGETLESLIGGRLFTWLGGILLVLATAFFVVWSWRNLELPDWSRCAMMHAVGLGTILLGSWFKKKDLEIHARAFYGVGIFGLYASALAMTHLYKLGGEMHQFYGFLDGALITALAVFLSLRNKSVGVILLGAFGGYLTPLLTIHGSGEPVIMFVYLALLNVALMISSYFGKWDFLKPIAWFATAATFLLCIATRFFDSAEQGKWLLAVHAGIFLIATSLPHLWWRRKSSEAGNIILVFNSIAFLGGFIILNRSMDDQVAWLSFVLAGIHAILTWYAFLILGASDRLGRIGLALTALFLTIGLTVLFRESPELWTTIWAVEALVFGLIGFAFRDKQMLISSAIVFAMTIVRSLMKDLDPQRIVEVTSIDPRVTHWLFYSVLATIVGSSRWWMPDLASRIASSSLSSAPKGLPNESAISASYLKDWASGFLVVGNWALLIAVVFHFQDQPRWTLLFAACNSAVLWLVGFGRSNESVRIYSSIMAIGVIVTGGLLLAESCDQLQKLWSTASRVSFVGTSLILTVAGFAYWVHRKSIADTSIERPANALFTTAGHLGLLTVLTCEIILFFGGPSIDLRNSTGEMVTWSIAWGIYAAILVAIGFTARYPLYRYLGIGLFSIVLCKVFLVDLAQFELIVRVVALMFLGLLLLGVSLLYQKFKQRIETGVS